MRRRGSFAAALGLLLTLTACDSGTSGPGLQPMVVAPTTTTQTFTGTVAVGSNAAHGFTVSSGGQVQVTLTAAGPPATIVMGLGIGSPSAGSCVLFTNGAVSTAAGTTPQLSGTAPSGSYCVAIFDVGNQTGPIDYTITVMHP